MSRYEKRLAQHLKEMEERRQADNDKVEELIEKKMQETIGATFEWNGGEIWGIDWKKM
jgi:hypothetical protein